MAGLAPAGSVALNPGTSQEELMDPVLDHLSLSHRKSWTQAGEGTGGPHVHLRLTCFSILKVTVNFKLRSLFTWQIGECCVLV